MVTKVFSGGEDPALKSLNIGVGRIPEVTREDLSMVPQAIEKCRSEGDARSLAGIYVYAQDMRVPPQLDGLRKGLAAGLEKDKELMLGKLGQYGEEGGPEFDIGSFADMHFRLRAVGVKTSIDEKGEWLVQGWLDNSRNYGNGWAVAHLRFHLHRLGVKDPGDASRDEEIAFYGEEGLAEARERKDGVAIAFMHHWMRGFGVKTEITGDDDSFIKKALGDARTDGDGRAVVAMHYLVQKLYEKPQDQSLLNAIPLK
ncbi:MAG: hypothetical protein NTU61_02140 [Candidatus Altiarchaeota archaeon]|nr:hypothetical protein [Candidatus Altiarchaeota archaeon]